jgi:hypothetical protein
MVERSDTHQHEYQQCHPPQVADLQLLQIAMIDLRDDLPTADGYRCAHPAARAILQKPCYRMHSSLCSSQQRSRIACPSGRLRSLDAGTIKHRLGIARLCKQANRRTPPEASR